MRAERDFLVSIGNADPDDVDVDELEDLDVPPVVECPCGDGYAERLTASRTEPDSKNAKRKITSFSYRHTGCPLGGEIVTEPTRNDDGSIEYEILRTIGPLFNPARWNSLATRQDVEAPVSKAVTDGGISE